jgi:hypothetical protein
MADVLDDLRAVQKLQGDTFSSAEVLGMVARAASEIERLRSQPLFMWNAELCEQNRVMREALREIEELADGHADADDGIPNDFMRVQMWAKRAMLAAAPKQPGAT